MMYAFTELVRKSGGIGGQNETETRNPKHVKNEQCSIPVFSFGGGYPQIFAPIQSGHQPYQPLHSLSSYALTLSGQSNNTSIAITSKCINF